LQYFPNPWCIQNRSSTVVGTNVHFNNLKVGQLVPAGVPSGKLRNAVLDARSVILLEFKVILLKVQVFIDGVSDELCKRKR
jgi:hypothetical protein